MCYPEGMKAKDEGGASGWAPLAVIEIGSTGIRMLVASIDRSGEVRVLDRAGKQSRIGRDVFTLGHVGREAVRESIAVLLSFRELLKGYGIGPADVRVIGTSALREASNRDTYVDRISLQTGFKVRVVEDIEENNLMYLAVQHVLQDKPELLENANAMIIEVGGGTTKLMLLNKGRMVAAHSLNIGTLRIDEQLRGSGASRDQLREYLQSTIKATCDNLRGDLPLESVRNFIVLGSDARFAANRLTDRMTSRNQGGYAVVDRQAFSEFAEKIAHLTPEECVATYHIPWIEAEGLVSGLTIERMFLEHTRAESVIIPDVSIRDGLLFSESLGPDTRVEEELRRQVMASAASLGRRYKFDEEHAKNVVGLSLAIFDALHGEYGMDKHERLLLEASAMLHDIGTFVRASGHHKHGEYIVQNSVVFGLNRADLTVVANVVRYHRKNPPASSHLNFIALPREDRMLVMKLAAILRVADSLDRSHSGRVHDLSFERSGERFVMRGADRVDLTLERMSLVEKGDMFEDVFGLAPVIT